MNWTFTAALYERHGDRKVIKPIDRDILIEGFVLAGGASSRMGQDKAQMSVGGKTFFERAATAMITICHRPVSVVGGNGTDLAVRTYPDIAFLPDLRVDGRELPRAPIVGLFTSLTYAKTPWIAILACDLPFVTKDLMTRLAGYCSDEFDAIVPVQPDGNLQPLCAIYRRERCLPVAEDMIEKGDLKMRTLVSSLHTRFVDFGELTDLSGSANFFFNVNKPEDYESALKIAAS